MSDQDERLTAIEARLNALEQRLLEPDVLKAVQPAKVLNIELADQLRNRSGPPYEGTDASGAIRYAGALQIDEGEVLWEIERAVPWLLALDAATVAPLLAALGSVPRLQIARALLARPHTSQQLQEVLGVASPGQLYHHLKELIAVGVVEQHGRSDYRLAPQKMVPLLVVVACAFELRSDNRQRGENDERE